MKKETIKALLAFPAMIFIFVCAAVGWFCEHVYNYITKGKWEGMDFR